MRPSRIALFTLALGALAACTPATETTAGGSSASEPFVPDNPTAYGPGDYCADTYVLLQPTTRSNFSLGSEYYRNDNYCAAYPYIKHIVETEPLFTGEDPDDRNFLRLASIYEDFAANVDSTNQAERVAYLDSALATRARGVQLMEEQGIEYDSYLRDLREGFFFFQNSAYYEDAEERKFEAFSRALEAQPDSLEDWYVTQLFTGSADEFGDELPNPERAAYVRRLADVVDDAALRENYTQFATYLESEPSVTGTVDDTAVRDLISSLRAGGIEERDAFTLLAVVLQQPERIEALGEDTAAIQSQLLRLDVITNNVDDPRTLLALSFQAYREGDSGRGSSLFDRAIQNAESNFQRADFYYSRSVSRYGGASDLTAALRAFPSHGPSLYTRATNMAQSVGTQRSLRGRFAYWCLADEFRSVAARTSGDIAARARTAAARYERAGPSREEYFLEGFRPGQSVSSSLGAYGSCTTRVR